jgi:hypothetical protein
VMATENYVEQLDEHGPPSTSRDLIPVVPFFREAYLNGQPALPKCLDSCRRKRVSIFGTCHGPDLEPKVSGSKEWSGQRSVKKLPRPWILPPFFLHAASTLRGYTL